VSSFETCCSYDINPFLHVMLFSGVAG
jgi:hypothetical protein